MAERKESEFHSCICSKLEMLTLPGEVGQLWRSISVCISFGDYKKMFEIDKKDLLPLPNEIGNIPGNGESQVERDLEELQIQIVDVQSMAIPILPTTSNQFNNSNDQPIHFTSTEMNIKSEITQTELDSEFELPTHLEVSLLSTHSTCKIDKTELFSLPTENRNVPGNQIERDLEEPQGQNNADQQSQAALTIPIAPTTSNQDSDDPSVHLTTTGRNSKNKRKRTKMDIGLESYQLKVSPMPIHSVNPTENQPKVETLSNQISTSTIQKKLHDCTTCGKQLSNKYKVIAHQKRMHPELTPLTIVDWKHECNVCSEKFLYLTKFNQHKLVHTKEQRKFKCSQCPNRYKYKGDLFRHLKMHENDSPFRCRMCQKVLASPLSLDTHIRTHTGEKPYQCQYCDKSFANESVLKAHLQRLHIS